MKSRLVFVLTAMLLAGPALAADDLSKGSDKQKFSYAVGFQITQDLRHQGLELDADAFAQAARDVLSNQPLKLTEEQMQGAIEKFQQQAAAEQAAKAEKTLKTGQAFLAENKAKKGVVTRPSGLQYQVIKDGGGKNPAATDTVEVNYRGTLIDGTEFDSSYKRGETATFPVNQVIQGWQEVLPLMKVGSHWKVFIPSDLAYGERGAGGLIGPNETLVFDIELLAIK
ncbi:MAG: FKBP-type peptidyl-prolyl cis-trans isomerase [Gammaproteobacteria bacterium]|nr:FKBP-type peptidyl-prolyl cis-trans isomerase [Gammaproteobacteria bacterium]